MRLFLVFFVTSLLSTPTFGAGKIVHSPWATTLKLRQLIQQELKPFNIRLAKPAQIRFEAKLLPSKIRNPTTWRQLGEGLELVHLHIHLTTLKGVPAGVPALLKQRLEAKSGFPFTDLTDFMITLSSTKSVISPKKPVVSRLPSQVKSTRTPKESKLALPTRVPSKPTPKPSPTRPTDQPTPTLPWLYGSLSLVFFVLLLAYWLRRQAESPKHDFFKLKEDLPGCAVSFADLREFDAPSSVDAPPLGPAQVTNDLVDLLLAEPSWAKELALKEGPQGLVRLCQLFGELSAQDIFESVLGKKQFEIIRAQAANQLLTEVEKNQLIDRLHQGFFAKKLVELRSLAQKKLATQPNQAPPVAKASFPEEEAGLAFLADATATEILRLILKESSLIQSLVMRHWRGNPDALEAQLEHPEDLSSSEAGQISLDLLDKITRLLESRLKELRDTPDPKALADLLTQLEGKTALERESILAHTTEQDRNLAAVARLNYLDVQLFSQLERPLLQQALKPLSAKVIAYGVVHLDKKTQEPVLLALEPKKRSSTLRQLRSPVAGTSVLLEAKCLLAQSLNRASQPS